ncbi:MAG TPA: nucleoside 2-deoxyribosyltransferase [Terrimicrobiaceae bacterium]
MRVDSGSLPRIYLAGPDVFFEKGLKIAWERKGFLATLGLEGVFPLDAQDETKSFSKEASSIFNTNRELIDSCEAVLANLTPFRGPSADVGTVWEIGYACGQRKPVAAYSDDLSVYRDKVFRHGWSSAPGETRDRDGNEIEDFAGIDNLMITESVIAICPTFEEAAITLKRRLVG